MKNPRGSEENKFYEKEKFIMKSLRRQKWIHKSIRAINSKAFGNKLLYFFKRVRKTIPVGVAKCH